MEKFIPYEKLSKKQRKAFNAQHRTLWTVNPVTRKPENPKAYNRKTRKRSFDDSSTVSFHSANIERKHTAKHPCSLFLLLY